MATHRPPEPEAQAVQVKPVDPQEEADEQRVLRWYPGAYAQQENCRFEIWSGTIRDHLIGSGGTELEAWRIARSRSAMLETSGHLVGDVDDIKTFQYIVKSDW